MNYEKIVKELREKLFLTQTDFARILGVSFTTVSRWETGVYEPSIKLRKKISELCIANNIKNDEN